MSFERQYLVLGAEDLLFVLLQFLRDISLGVHERLFADPFGRHFVLICIAHFEVVAEDIVVGYLQALYARCLGLALLDLEQVVLAAVGYLPQLVEFLAYAAGDDVAFLYHQRRIGLHLTGDAVANADAGTDLFADALQGVVVGSHADLLDGLDSLQRHFELYDIAWRHTSRDHLRRDALEVSDEVQAFGDELAELRMTEIVVHDIQALVDLHRVAQRKQQPTMEKTCPHGCNGVVEHIEQRASALVHRLHEFEVAHGELIESHVTLLFDAADAGEVLDLCVLREFEVL